MGAAKHPRGKIAEEADLIEKDREDGHREKENKDLQGVDSAVRDERAPDLGRVAKAERQHGGGTEERDGHVAVDQKAAKAELRVKEHREDHRE